MCKGIYHLVKQIVVLFYYLMCNLCPVKQNRIVFDSSLGKSYSGNPKHIYEYLMANGYDLNWDCIWFYENEKYNIPGMSRQVRYGRLRYLYYMATAKVWVFDTRQPEFLLRRKGTYYIQTWHGTPLKKLALDMEDVFMVGESDIDSYKEHFTKNVHTWDFLISQNPFSSETFRRAFDFHKEMLEYGYPKIRQREFEVLRENWDFRRIKRLFCMRQPGVTTNFQKMINTSSAHRFLLRNCKKNWAMNTL